MEIKVECKCGGKLEVSGSELAVAFRHIDWLSHHKPCIKVEDEKVETVEK